MSFFELSNPTLPDADGNGVPDCIEVSRFMLDSDGGGIPDRIEHFYGLNSMNPADDAGDLDGDGWTNVPEHLAGHSLNADFAGTYDWDHDGMTNVWEIAHGLNPYDATDANGCSSGSCHTPLPCSCQWVGNGCTCANNEQCSGDCYTTPCSCTYSASGLCACSTAAACNDDCYTGCQCPESSSGNCGCSYAGQCEPASQSGQGSAPDLQREGEEYVLWDQAETVEFTASGGSAPEPSSGCGPFTMGQTKYIFTYSELTGDQASGSPADSDTLHLNRDPDGYADVTVEIQQEWIDANGRTQTNTSPKSSPVPSKVQKPSKASQVGGGVQSTRQEAAGTYDCLEFTYDVLDKKNNKLQTGNGLMVYETLSVQTSVSCPYQKSDGTQETHSDPGNPTPKSDKFIGSISNGQFKDPIGAATIPAAQSAEAVINNMGGTVPIGTILTITVTTSNHRYAVNVPGAGKVELEGTFNHSVTIKAIKNADRSWSLQSVSGN